MQCSECGAEVSPLREFCPKCGTPTDPGLRERRHHLDQRPRSTGEIKSNRKRVLIAAAAVIGLGAAANIAFDPDWDSEDRPAVVQQPEARGAVTITADELYKAYRDDEEGAERRFDEREMVVTGEFQRIVPDGYESLDLRLKTSNPEAHVGVDLAQLAIEDGKKLRPGQQVTVSCQSMGDVGDELWVRDCAIQPNTETGAAPASSTPSAPAVPSVSAPDEGNSA
ncbi:MAG TPA: zinc-ribbon domain-containing protein [Sphingomicrobium sp.]